MPRNLEEAAHWLANASTDDLTLRIKRDPAFFRDVGVFAMDLLKGVKFALGSMHPLSDDGHDCKELLTELAKATTFSPLIHDDRTTT